MDKSKRNIVIIIAVLVVGIFGATMAYRTLGSSSQATSQQAEPSSTSTQEQEKPYLKDYNATVYTKDGTPTTLVDLAASKPLVINFWATWCPYCVEEMPDFQKIYQEYGDRVSFAFVDSNDGQRETVESATTWLKDNGLEELPTYFDTDYEASKAFGAYSLPTTIVVAADGEIVQAGAGAIDPTLMRAQLNELV